MKSVKCTAAVLTFNSEKTLRKTLSSVEDFSDIIICDGGSTDGTLEIAKSYGARVIPQGKNYCYPDGRIKDFAGIRNQTLSAAKEDWFFFIDSDEYVEPPFVLELQKIISEAEVFAFWVPRKYVIDGKVIDCAATYPNRQMRLFHRGHAKKFIKAVHERIELLPGEKTAILGVPMYIPFNTSVPDMRRKWDFYLGIELEREPVTARRVAKAFYTALKASVLYASRYVRNIFTCRGTHMPFSVEMERHRYNAVGVIQLTGALFKKWFTGIPK